MYSYTCLSWMNSIHSYHPQLHVLFIHTVQIHFSLNSATNKYLYTHCCYLPVDCSFDYQNRLCAVGACKWPPSTTVMHRHTQRDIYNSLNDPHVQSRCDVLAPIDIRSPELSHQPHLIHPVYIIQIWLCMSLGNCKVLEIRAIQVHAYACLLRYVKKWL